MPISNMNNNFQTGFNRFNQRPTNIFGGQMPMQQDYANQTPQTSAIYDWIQGGEQTAKAYTMPPNCIAMLFDGDEKTFFIKRTDSIGRAYPLEIYDYSQRESKTAQPVQEESAAPEVVYATPDDVRNIVREELSAFSEKLPNFKHKPQQNKKEVSDNA